MTLRNTRQRDRRSGKILIMAALLLVVLIGMVAMAVDTGYIGVAKRQLQRSTDAAAHAAALLITNQTNARVAAKDVIQYNPVAGAPIQLANEDILFGTRGTGTNGYSTFLWGNAPYNAVKVIGRKTTASVNGPVKLFFANILGRPSVDMTATSIAVVYPRDIVFVLDVSGSMHHDGEMWAIPLLNFVSPGAGTRVLEAEWADFGLTGVPLDIVDNQTSTYTFDFNDRTKNQTIELPRLYTDSTHTALQSAAASATYYTSNSRGATSGYVSVDAGGKIQAQLDYANILALCGNAEIGARWPNSPVNWQVNYNNNYNGTETQQIGAYDLIIDQYLSKVMPLAKPSLTDAATRDTYRDYWRGYVNYLRGFSSGSNAASDGIDGCNNPSNTTNGRTNETDYKLLYRNPDAPTIAYSGSLSAVMDKLKNHANYATYIQFMMDQANERTVGVRYDGSSTAGTQRFSPKQMNKWLAQTGLTNTTDTNVYQRWSADYQQYLPAREFPCGAVLEAVLAACKQFNADNIGLSSSIRDRVAVVAFTNTTVVASGTPTAPFLDVVDQYQDLQMAVIKATQSMDNGTNTMSGIRIAEDWFTNYGRSSASRVVILFTDGEANQSTNPKSIPNYSTLKIDLDGEGIKDDLYYLNSGTYQNEKNAALREVEDLYALNATVNSVVAGVGKDAFVQRMSLLSNGIFQDSGANYDQYGPNLIRDFEKLAKVRAITFAIEH